MGQGRVDAATGAVQPELNGDEVVSLLESQRNICRRLKEVAERQQELISLDDPSRLLASLADRRRLTDELAGVSGRLVGLPERLDSVGGMSVEQRSRAEEMLEEVRRTLREVMAADSEDVKRLKIRKHRVGEELQSIPASREMLSAYGRGGEGSGFDGTDEQG